MNPHEQLWWLADTTWIADSADSSGQEKPASLIAAGASGNGRSLEGRVTQHGRPDVRLTPQLKPGSEEWTGYKTSDIFVGCMVVAAGRVYRTVHCEPDPFRGRVVLTAVDARDFMHVNWLHEQFLLARRSAGAELRHLLLAEVGRSVSEPSLTFDLPLGTKNLA